MNRIRLHHFIWLVVLIGVVLRLTWLSDMEYKFDEKYMFERVRGFLDGSEPWQWIGMPSGVSLRNPGMSIWVFEWLGWLFRVTEPVGLARAVALCNCLAIVLTAGIGSGWRFGKAESLLPEGEREPWLWAAALVAVNPLALMVHRKIWAQSILPLFCVLFLISFWKRRSFGPAVFWGLIGALLGQIHMSGFFFAAALAGWVLLFDRRNTNWKGWFTGSVIGALPLLPWIHYWATEHHGGKPLTAGFQEAIQLKFWVFWITDSLGLHVGHQLGVLRGPRITDQIGDFLRYPLWNGQPTYVMAVAHLLLIAAGLAIVIRACLKIRLRPFSRTAIGGESQTDLTRNGLLLGYGGLLTGATIWVRRYYLIITFPFEWVALAQLALGRSTLTVDRRYGRLALVLLLLSNLLISLGVLHYVHVNGGALQGEYGPSYRSQ